MKDAKHTPGPWRVLGSVTTTKQGTHNLHIGHGDADTFSPMLAEVLSDGDRLPKEANARLIAAAPDLLRALEEARAMLETASRYFPKSIRNGDRYALLNVLANSVEPAIQKAGKQ